MAVQLQEDYSLSNLGLPLKQAIAPISGPRVIKGRIRKNGMPSLKMFSEGLKIWKLISVVSSRSRVTKKANVKK